MIIDPMAASQRCAYSARYFAMAHADPAAKHYAEMALSELQAAADAMGFDLVKREDAAPKLEAAE